MVAGIVIAVCLVASPLPASAGELTDPGSDWTVRWDNTLKYSLGVRTSWPDSRILSFANIDDGDRNFSQGSIISDRVDLLSEFDVSYERKLGLRVSAAAWYDNAYDGLNDNNSPGTSNNISTATNEFPRGTSELAGRKVDLLDAFAYDNFSVEDVPVNVRLGRHTIIWGESLFFGANGVAQGQGPIDVIKLAGVPGSQFKEILLPVNQLSGEIQLAGGLTVKFYNQFEYRQNRITPAGSFFNDVDFVDVGAQSILLQGQPGGPIAGFLRRENDVVPSNLGQGGLGLTYTSSPLHTDFGIYGLIYDDKNPQVIPTIDPTGASVRGIPEVGQYKLVFPANIKLFGVSANTELGDTNIAAELSARIDTPLETIAGNVPASGQRVDSYHPDWAVGDSLHANLSDVYLLRPNGFWGGGDILAEAGFNTRLAVTQHANLVDNNFSKTALGFRTIFEPTWFEVFPSVQLTVPIGFGINALGPSQIVQKFNGSHAAGGGDASIGAVFVYKTTWTLGVSYTQNFGSNFGKSTNGVFFDSSSDREYVSMYVQHSF